MFRLRQHEDVHVEHGDAPGILEVRRVSGADTRWSCRLDVAAAYGERFGVPEAFAIDARFGADGALHLIAHAFDRATRRLLPPREISFLDGMVARTRAGADRHALEANEHVIAGGIHWQVTAETATTFTLADARTIEKAEATGPFLRLARYRDWTIRIAQELDDHVLAVLHGAAARELGWSVGLTKESAEVGFRWFERDELGHLERHIATSPCSTCATAGDEHRAGFNTIAVERAGEQDHRRVACSACHRVWTVAQGALGWTWALATVASAPAPAKPTPKPAPTTVELERHLWIAVGGRQLVLEYERADTWSFAIESHEVRDDLSAAGLVQEENRDDRMCAPGYVYTGEFNKLDPKISGAYLYLVRFAGHILRVIAEDDDSVLLICNWYIASDLELFERRDRTSFRWVKKSDVQVLGDDEPVAAPAPAPAPQAISSPSPLPGIERKDTRLMDDAYKELGVRYTWMELESESRTGFEFRLRLSAPNEELIAAGCDCSEGYDDRAGESYADHTLNADKTAREVTGAGELVEYRGYQLRSIARRDGQALLIAHFGLASTLGFERYNSLCYRWIPIGEVKAVR